MSGLGLMVREFPSPTRTTLPPVLGGTNCDLTACIRCRAVDGTFDTVSAGQCADFFHRVIGRVDDMINKTHVLHHFNAVFVHFYTNQFLRAHCPAEHQCGHTNWTETDNQHRIITADADFFDGLIDSAETTGDRGSIFISQLVWKRN